MGSTIGQLGNRRQALRSRRDFYQKIAQFSDRLIGRDARCSSKRVGRRAEGQQETKRLAMRIIAVMAFAMVLMMARAEAQGMGDAAGAGTGGFGGRHHGQQQRNAQTATPKPKADEKAYNAALKAIPDKQYDPWHGMH
jgi:hypothetical protein